ncbi:TPM domain-containing protein [Bradyrhizobium sp.]|uniref:TPM domain-containing protein n=1 Tax=Bradyrhizobium sp. TaxID=376 RepID=UPI001D472415|nr:TPM domain-containing protein [Bradyrhizobium sp.]MBI5322053.1 TPM domain-containing protein [Bradyrhizobium sp.]
MGIRRIGRHLLEHRWRERRIFPPKVLARIEQAIKAGEASHSGQIRFVVEGALDGRPLFRDQPARERAIDVFSQLRIWDTEHNNGVLIYLLLADRDVEIVADRGINAKVGATGWEKICAAMEKDFRAGLFEHGVIEGIQEVSRLMAQHFPKRPGTPNELPDAPVVL